MTARPSASTCLLLGFTALTFACSDDPESQGDDGISGMGTADDGESDTAEAGDDLPDGDDDSVPDDECISDLDCTDGACVDGSCCDLADACGDECCGAGEVCLFDSCTMPGDSCTTASDCGDDQYCELGLGEASPGFGEPPDGLSCIDPLPATGRCINLPVVCTGGANDPDDCVEPCEFMPEPGELNATLEWQWGHDAPLPEKTDVWSTPTVARIYDANCDGKLDDNDAPNVVFVASNSNETCCSCGNPPVSNCRNGALTLLDGRTGEQVWQSHSPEEGSIGWAGASVALGDIDKDGRSDIVALTGEGKVALIDANGQVLRLSDQPVADIGGGFGWGGGLAIADMDQDGHPEIAFARSLFTTTDNAITRKWVGTGGLGRELSYMVDLTGDGNLELLAGNTAYDVDGNIVWQADVPDGFTATGDFDGDGTPEVVVVRGDVWLLDAATGAIEAGPVDIPSEDTRGGPPTVADFDGDGAPEIGIAGGSVYVVYEPDLSILWQHGTKDTSSAVTGSSVFDFEGDGKAEVVYSDECFLRVLDGETGALRFAASNTTFTATEALIVADVDGDASAEIVRVSNSANWSCNTSPWIDGDPATGLPPWQPASAEQVYYRGLSVFGSANSSWVGTRTLWNQHAYSVTNICSGTDSACATANDYAAIPTIEQPNWLLPWLNNFRQNVQDSGVFNAPNATVDIDVPCSDPMIIRVNVRNAGLAPLPAGVVVSVRRVSDDSEVGEVVTDVALSPGQIASFELATGLELDSEIEFYGVIVTDSATQTFVECKVDDNSSEPAKAFCGIG